MRPRTFQTCAINIVAQPHPPGIYEDLFDCAIAERPPVHIHRDQYGKFGPGVAKELRLIDFEGGHSTIYYGDIHFFTRIDPQADWYDVINECSVTNPNHVEAIRQIQQYGPNDRKFRFVFFPDRHLLIFETRALKHTVTAQTMKLFLTSSLTRYTNKFHLESIDLTIEPSRRAVEEIITMSDLASLEMLLQRPNPGDALPSGLEDDIFEEMDTNGIREEYTTLKRSKSKPIHLTPRRIDFIRVAARNGFVKGVGFHKSKRSNIATDKRPLEYKNSIRIQQNDNPNDPRFFIQHSVRMLEYILNSIRKVVSNPHRGVSDADQ